MIKKRGNKVFGISFLIIVMSLSFIGIFTQIEKVAAVTPVVTVSAPTFVYIDGGAITVSVTANQVAYLLELYVDGVKVKSGTNKISLSYTFTPNLIKKYTILGRGYFEQYVKSDTKYTRVRYHITDPDSSTKNLLSDGYRAPNSGTVYDAQQRMIEQSSYSISDITQSSMNWALGIWEIMSDPTKIPHIGSYDWYSDVAIASDYLADNDLEANIYACADFAVFISGMARAVGIPSRVWSLVYYDDVHEFYTEHMVCEVYCPNYYNATSGEWLMMSISGNLATHRVCWEDFYEGTEAQIDNFYAEMTAEDKGTYWETYCITLIYDLTYQPVTSTIQEKCWFTIDYYEPSGTVKIGTTDYSFYGIHTETTYSE